MKKEIKLKNLTFRKENDRLEIYHQLSHVTLNITLGKNEIDELTRFMNNTKSNMDDHSDMRIPGVGC